MTRTHKIFAMIAVSTLVSVLYVHQQLELVKLSYAIETKEKRLKQMLDHKDILGYNVENLQSPSRLESVLLAKKVDIVFPKRDQVVAHRQRSVLSRAEHASQAINAGGKTFLINVFDFLGLRAEAQAKEK